MSECILEVTFDLNISAQDYAEAANQMADFGVMSEPTSVTRGPVQTTTSVR
jgi:hypothetical protein